VPPIDERQPHDLVVQALGRLDLGRIVGHR
jgi:hypothetical protein